VKIQTTRFGELEVADDRIIAFPRGVLGFDQLRSYLLMDHGDTPIKWLQSTEDPDVAFMVVDPFLFFPDYVPDISPVEKKLIDIKDPSEVAIMAIMNVQQDRDPPITLNLQAPLIFNAARMTGFQIVMEKSKFGVREAVTLG